MSPFGRLRPATPPPSPSPDPVLPPPVDIGLPPKFTAWRPGQDAAVVRVVDADQRVSVAALPTGYGKSAFYVAVARLVGRTCILTSTKALQDQLMCVTPDTRVCTGDLRWALAGTVKVGDTLLGFDEFRHGNRRNWRPAVVEQVRAITKPCYRLVLSDGTAVTCSADHRWLTRGKIANMPAWVATRDLRADGARYPAHYLCKVLDVWETATDRDGGYLAAAFDGEGHLSQTVAKHRHTANGIDVNLSFAQVANPMLDEVKAALARKGYDFAIAFDDRASKNPRHTNCARLTIGGRRNILRFLGEIRPVRLLPKLNLDRLGMLNPAVPVRIVRKDFVGEQTVLAIQTSTRTYVAEGLASHNCDFKGMGMVEVRGQNAYPCRALTEPSAGHVPELGALRVGIRKRPDAAAGAPTPAADGYTRTSCDEGPCHVGLHCTLREAGCHYYDAVRTADGAELVVTNYAFWMAANAYRVRRLQEGEDHPYAGPDDVVHGIGQFRLLVLDEAHDAPDALSTFLTVTLERAPIEGLLGQALLAVDATPDQWRAWAGGMVALTERLIDRAKERAVTVIGQAGGYDRGAGREVKELKAILRAVTMLATPGVDWVVEPVKVEGHVPDRPDLTFAPIWPAPLAEGYLFCKTPKLLLVSATVRPKTLDYLGIARDQALFFEAPSSFPVERRRVIYIPTVKLDYRVSEYALATWLTRIDQIIRARPGVRGIIHTGSYDRMRYIAERSQFRSRLLWHRSGKAWGAGGRTLAQALEEFRRRDPGDGLWLISPSVTTGYDFPGDLCRVQIVTKVPFPDTRSALQQARTDRDPAYGMYQTMQTLVQMVGRGTRSEDDWSETFVIDDQFSWFSSKYRIFAPSWFTQAIVRTDLIPDPPVFGKGAHG